MKRLELSVLHDFVELGRKIGDILGVQDYRAFSDSKVALHQSLKGHKSRTGMLKAYVAKRVEDIFRQLYLFSI